MRFPLFLAIGLGLVRFAAAEPPPPAFRTWTDAQQRKVEAALEKSDGTSVTLKMRDGREFTVPISSLSALDRDLIKAAAAPGSAADTSQTPPAEADWPRTVVLKSTPVVQTVREDADKKEFVYESEHYQFLCDSMLGANLVREFSRVFEATWLVNCLLPLDFKPSPEDGHKKFQARIFTHESDYHDTGGPQGSSGVYIPQARALMVPLDSLGVKMFGSKVIVDYKAEDYATLVHEITHQMMNHWLDQLPVWYIEGSAVYVELAKYDNGHFSFLQQDKRLHDYLFRGTNGGKFQMVPIQKLMNLTGREWTAALLTGDSAENYQSAVALTYYFYHLDDDGTGTHFKDYIRAVSHTNSDRGGGELIERYLLRGRTYAALQKDVEKSLRRIGIPIDFTVQ